MNNKINVEQKQYRTPYVVTTGVSHDAEVRSLRTAFAHHLVYSLVKEHHAITDRDCLHSFALTTRARLIDQWIASRKAQDTQKTKRISYLSLEFLVGRTLGNYLINLGLYDHAHRALRELGYCLEDIEDAELDAGLGNGGLGRLAACFMDSLATLGIPACGYGIRYEYGIFHQQIKDGHQVETPDQWLRDGNPWEVARPEYRYTVNFYGYAHQHRNDQGHLKGEWVEPQEIIAVAYDTPVPGYRNDTVNTLRLWSAQAPHEFDLNHFNNGDYQKAVEQKSLAETITRVLYPNDAISAGRELRLKQQYFFVSATLQDIIRVYRAAHTTFDAFPNKHAIQLNDTHPVLAIPELMRILVDLEGLEWDDAWTITTRTFAFTNHTVLPEAMEQWPVDLFGHVLPRHLQIIYEINRHFLRDLGRRYLGDLPRQQRMSIVGEDGEKTIRMAHLAIVGSHAVNGVATLHSQILKEDVFKDFYRLWPEKFHNVTNGITPRRWLKYCNPGLATLVTEHIGDGWVTDLSELRKLAPLAADSEFQARWQLVKQANKMRLADYIAAQHDLTVDVKSIFDCQIKRIHEYKRQLLNALHVVTLYNRLKANPQTNAAPRTVIFAGKAASGYEQAKLIIKLINAIADEVNYDPDVGDRLKVVFLSDYGVSLAEKIIPAADLSEQISTAGKEASGTGNMKFALNGALTIGTLDGANVEIAEEVGSSNIFIFGLTKDLVRLMKSEGYIPHKYYAQNPELKQALDMIDRGDFSPDQPDLFKPLVHSLLHEGDPYMVLADYAAYIGCQERVDVLYRDQDAWTQKSILNCAYVGKFSSDRAIQQYANEIWGIEPIETHADHTAVSQASG